MRLCFTLFVLLFTQLFLNLAHAAPNKVSYRHVKLTAMAKLMSIGARRVMKPTIIR